MTIKNGGIYRNLLTQLDKTVKHNRQGSYKTRERYHSACKRFCGFLADYYRLEKLANVAPKHIKAYAKHMQDKGLAPSTIKTDLAAVRFWHDKISDARYKLPSNDEFDLERRTFGKVDRTWSDREYELMLDECVNAGRADYKACMVIARNLGLRLHETFRIDTAIAKAALKNGFITIKGKGGKIRDIPVNEAVKSEFEAFLKTTPAGHKLFVPQGKDTHIAMTELENFIADRRKHVKDAGSTRPMSYHGLRHNFAVETYRRLIAEGYSELDAKKRVSELLGHNRLEIADIYLASTKGGGADV